MTVNRARQLCSGIHKVSEEGAGQEIHSDKLYCMKVGSTEKVLHLITFESPHQRRKHQDQYQYEWGRCIRQPMHCDHFLIYCASPSALFHQQSRTPDTVQYLNRILYQLLGSMKMFTQLTEF
jgi:hypothetical protein